MTSAAPERAGATTFDAIVIGAGPAGEVCSGRLGEAGLDVAVVEKHLIGGECSFYGCMPSKSLLRPGEAIAEARRIPGAREAVTGELDVEAVLSRRDEVIHNRDDTGMLPWLEDRGVTVVRGSARIAGERRVEVDGRTLEARRAVVVATGSEAAVPPIPGLAESGLWTNRDATTSERVPERLIVLGGGVVGVELGQAWHSLGSQVTIVEAQPRLLGREEEFAATEVHDALVARGIEVRTGEPAVEVSRNGAVTVRLESGDELQADELLVAVGRRPATRELGLESVGLEPGRYIEVDETLRVPGSDWLYAIGDANGRALLTHMGKYQGRVAADVILGKDARLDPRAGDALSPRVVFTDPQVAAVGHTLAIGARGGHRGDRRRPRDLRRRRRELLRPRLVGHVEARRRRPAPGAGGRDLRRRRGLRVRARGDDRDRRRGPARSPLARDAVLPDAERGLAAPARALRPLVAMGAERDRLNEVPQGRAPWRHWGPYLSERAWGTVREDYSPGGDAWEYFPHDHARSRAYRWNEDGLAGISRRPPAPLLRARVLERSRPDPEGAHLRAHGAAGKPRRGRQGVLVVPRLDADALVHALAVHVPAGRVPVRAARRGERPRAESTSPSSSSSTPASSTTAATGRSRPTTRRPRPRTSSCG